MPNSPKRIVSLQPSVTTTLDHLGLLDRVVACTKYCVDVCPSLRDHPKIIVSDSWTANSAQILAASPDLVIASVPYQLDAVAEILKAGVPFLGLAPHSLNDVYGDIARISLITFAVDQGDTLISAMKDQVSEVRALAQIHLDKSTGDRPLVYCEEWGKPLIHSQHWVAELVDIAGGRFLGTPGAHTDADTIRASDPEIIVAAWCGAGDRVPLEKIIAQRNWQDTRAAKNNRVHCVRDEFLNTPGPTLMSGLRELFRIIHPM